MKYLLLLMVLWITTGCTGETTDVSRDFQLPHDLKDCRLIRLTPDGMSSDRVYILKCPEGYLGTSTTYNDDDYRVNNTVIIP